MNIEQLLRQELVPVAPTPKQQDSLDIAMQKLLLTIKLAKANLACAQGCGDSGGPYAEVQLNERGKPVHVCRYFTPSMVENHHEAGFEDKPCPYLGKLGVSFAHHQVQEHFQCTYRKQFDFDNRRRMRRTPQ